MRLGTPFNEILEERRAIMGAIDQAFEESLQADRLRVRERQERLGREAEAAVQGGISWNLSSLTTVISYWNPCIWLAESKFVSEKHWQNTWWNAPQMGSSFFIVLYSPVTVFCDFLCIWVTVVMWCNYCELKMEFWHKKPFAKSPK